jgi:hypothetical protein
MAPAPSNLPSIPKVLPFSLRGRLWRLQTGSLTGPFPMQLPFSAADPRSQQFSA